MRGERTLPHFQVRVRVVDHRLLELLGMCQEELDVRSARPWFSRLAVSSRYTRLPVLAPPSLRFPRSRSSLVVRLACPISTLWFLFAFLDGRLNALAQATGTLSIQPTGKNGDNREHVTDQLFSRLLGLGLIEHFKTDMLPLKSLIKIATPKAHQAIGILNQHHIDGLLSHESQQFFHAPPPFVEAGGLRSR